MIHRYEPDTDRCVCGGVIVYYDTWPGDPEPERGVGEGCEVAGLPWHRLTKGEAIWPT